MTWRDYLWCAYLLGFVATFVVMIVVGFFVKDGCSFDAYVAYFSMSVVWPVILAWAIHCGWQRLTVKPVRLPPEGL